MGSRSVLLPLLMAFVVYALGTIDIPTAVGKRTAIEPVKPKVIQ